MPNMVAIIGLALLIFVIAGMAIVFSKDKKDNKTNQSQDSNTTNN